MISVSVCLSGEIIYGGFEDYLTYLVYLVTVLDGSLVLSDSPFVYLSILYCLTRMVVWAHLSVLI